MAKQLSKLKPGDWFRFKSSKKTYQYAGNSPTGAMIYFEIKHKSKYARVFDSQIDRQVLTVKK